LEPDAFSGAVAGPGRRVSAEGRTATEDWEADGLYGRCVVAEEKHFSAFCFSGGVAMVARKPSRESLFGRTGPRRRRRSTRKRESILGVASEKRDDQETAEPAPLCMTNIKSKKRNKL